MKILDKRHLPGLKGTELVELECLQCSKSFFKRVVEVRSVLKNSNGKNTLNSCSIRCSKIGKSNPNYKNGACDVINTKCDWCQNSIIKLKIEFENNMKHFCNRSCSAKYGNTHRRYGNSSRSKCELYIEKRIKEDFSKLKTIYNSRNIINGLELDIYFPDRKIAIEINGKGHYFPIYGEEALKIRKEKDQIKKKLCKNKKICLYIIKLGNNKNLQYYEKKYQKIKNILKRG